MDGKKVLKIALLGVAVAAVICVIAGICIYVPALGLEPLRSDPDYSAAMADKIRSMQIGMLILIVGCSCLIISFLAFVAAILFEKLSKQRSEDGKDNKNITE